LKLYSNSKRFKREALRVVCRLLSENEIRNLREAFRSIDTGHTGTISVDELQQAMIQLGFSHTRDEIMNVVNELDYEGKNQIKYLEFIAATMDQKKFLTKEKLWTVFKHFDTDNSGFITQDNLKEAMARTGRKLSNDEINGMMKEIDTNNDGKVHFEQFCNMMNEGDVREFDSFFNGNNGSRSTSSPPPSLLHSSLPYSITNLYTLYCPTL
jgi:calcium-dependent protein kinase